MAAGAQGPGTPGRTIFDVLADAKKSIVFLGYPGEERPNIVATGFLIELESIFHLVTARHVIVAPDGSRLDANLTAYFNLKSGVVGATTLAEMRQKLGTEWVMAADGKVDVAMMPFGFNPGEADVLSIPKALFLPLSELPETTDLLFLGFQPNALESRKIAPIIRGGMVSRLNDDGTFYMDGPAFPGNSGSPVFVRPASARITKTGTTLGGDPIAFRFVGLVGEYIPYVNVAISPQTKRPRISFEENTGLTRIWSADHFNRLTETPEFREQIAGLRARGFVN